MTDVGMLRSGVPNSGGAPLRTLIGLAIFAVGMLASVLAGGLLYKRAHHERLAIAEDARDKVAALAFAFDQEVAALNYLLKGISKSPAIDGGDLEVLYRQLKATPVPEGSWLVFQDPEGQVLNTIRPFGAPLPRHAPTENDQKQIERIRDRGWTVSGRIVGPATGRIAIALSLRLDDARGQMKNWLTILVSDVGLRKILDAQSMPAGWAKGLYDQTFQPIIGTPSLRARKDSAAPVGLPTSLLHAAASDSGEGFYESKSEDGTPIHVSYRRSGATNWTTMIQLPLADLNAPMHIAYTQIALLVAALLIYGAFAASIIVQRAEAPFLNLKSMLRSSAQQVGRLSDQLLTLQYEERQRIARELHDSTVQHLVAANLSLIALDIASTEPAEKARQEIELQIDRALRELRIFSYLLHPPELAKEGLQSTLRDFVEGFAARTKLEAKIRIREEIDQAPFDVQWSILRVVQEALANIHRHAQATTIQVDARITRGHLFVRIRDDGRGIDNSASVASPVRFGVGIPGMRARIKQWGGDLRIRTGTGGTGVIASVPLSLANRRSRRPGRLLGLISMRKMATTKRTTTDVSGYGKRAFRV